MSGNLQLQNTGYPEYIIQRWKIRTHNNLTIGYARVRLRIPALASLKTKEVKQTLRPHCLSP